MIHRMILSQFFWTVAILGFAPTLFSSESRRLTPETLVGLGRPGDAVVSLTDNRLPTWLLTRTWQQLIYSFATVAVAVDAPQRPSGDWVWFSAGVLQNTVL